MGVILGICTAGALAMGDPGWGLRGRWNIYVAAALSGLAYAALVEHATLATRCWSYTERMPMVPALAAGLWPLPQMKMPPPLTFRIARRWAGRSATKGVHDEPDDEPYRRMDGRMDGRRDVGLEVIGVLVAVLLLVLVNKLTGE